MPTPLLDLRTVLAERAHAFTSNVHTFMFTRGAGDGIHRSWQSRLTEVNSQEKELHAKVQVDSGGFLSGVQFVPGIEVNTMTILRWVHDEQKTEKAKKGSKHV